MCVAQLERDILRMISFMKNELLRTHICYSIRNIQNLSVMRLKLCKMKEKKLQERLCVLERGNGQIESEALTLDESGVSIDFEQNNF